MKSVECTCCGSKELLEDDGSVVCAYCRSRLKLEVSDHPPKGAIIDFQSDIQALFNKCVEDPANRRRYVNLILDIDPSNQKAKQYLL
jgi:hypothetical protein